MKRTFCDDCGLELTMSERTALSLLQLGHPIRPLRACVQAQVFDGNTSRLEVCAGCFVSLVTTWADQLPEQLDAIQKRALQPQEKHA